MEGVLNAFFIFRIKNKIIEKIGKAKIVINKIISTILFKLSVGIVITIK